MLAAIVVGIGQIDTNAPGASLQSLRVWPCLVLIALGVPLLWTVERRAADPVVATRAACARRSCASSRVIAIAVGAAEAGMVFLPAMAVLNFSIDEKSASLTMLPLVLTLAVGAPLAGWLLDHVGARSVGAARARAHVSPGYCCFGLLPLDWPNFYLSGALVGFGMSALLGARRCAHRVARSRRRAPAAPGRGS